MDYLCRLVYYQDEEGQRLAKNAWLIISKFITNINYSISHGQSEKDRDRLEIKAIQNASCRIKHHTDKNLPLTTLYMVS